MPNLKSLALIDLGVSLDGQTDGHG